MSYHEGMNLSCGEGETLSRVKVLTEGKIIITHGFGLGQVMTIKDWFVLTGADDSFLQENIDAQAKKAFHGILKNKNDPVLKTHSVQIREPSPEQKHFSVEQYYMKDSMSGEPEFVPYVAQSTSIPIRPKSKIPWYMKYIMCGMDI